MRFAPQVVLALLAGCSREPPPAPQSEAVTPAPLTPWLDEWVTQGVEAGLSWLVEKQTVRGSWEAHALTLPRENLGALAR